MTRRQQAAHLARRRAHGPMVRARVAAKLTEAKAAARAARKGEKYVARIMGEQGIVLRPSGRWGHPGRAVRQGRWSIRMLVDAAKIIGVDRDAPYVPPFRTLISSRSRSHPDQGPRRKGGSRAPAVRGDRTRFTEPTYGSRRARNRRKNRVARMARRRNRR